MYHLQNRRMKWKKDEAKQRPRPESPSDTEDSGNILAASPSSSSAAETEEPAQHGTAISCKTTKDMNANEEKNSSGDILDSTGVLEKHKSTEIVSNVSLLKSHSIDSSRSSDNGTVSPRSMSNISP